MELFGQFSQSFSDFLSLYLNLSCVRWQFELKISKQLVNFHNEYSYLVAFNSEVF